ncbi:MAG TPA: type I DNA topoisomerase, partial [Candidatus Sulfotelmatobacter sp.]|nr:type I DNA topoisomerase [Candidatus Sulfotelmatobacter sp.]
EGRFGRFYSCSTYPTCKEVKPIPIGVNCPKCGAPLAARRTKRGRTFYGCTAYSKDSPNSCDFSLWHRPIPEPCPTCQAPFLIEKRSKAGVTIACFRDDCDYERPGDGQRSAISDEQSSTGEAASVEGQPSSEAGDHTATPLKSS